jgi:hypothetical protein
MRGLDPRIHASQQTIFPKKGVDDRVKPGHDDLKNG